MNTRERFARLRESVCGVCGANLASEVCGTCGTKHEVRTVNTLQETLHNDGGLRIRYPLESFFIAVPMEETA